MGVTGSNRRKRNRSALPAGKVGAPAAGGKLQFTISSNLASGHEVQQKIVNAARRLGYGEQTLFGMRLAMEEALVNAIRHGNKLDPSKKVRVSADLSGERAEIVIEDEGPGFERTGIPDPRLEQNIERCCGRGLLLMESFMDRVEYGKGGRRIRMVKENPRHDNMKP